MRPCVSCSVGEECTEAVPQIVEACMQTDVALRPSAKDLVGMLQVPRVLFPATPLVHPQRVAQAQHWHCNVYQLVCSCVGGQLTTCVLYFLYGHSAAVLTLSMALEGLLYKVAWKGLAGVRGSSASLVPQNRASR